LVFSGFKEKKPTLIWLYNHKLQFFISIERKIEYITKKETIKEIQVPRPPIPSLKF